MITRIKKIITSFFIPTNLISPATKDLSDSVVVITGASQGIGLGIATVLHREGAQLILVARDISKLEKATKTFDNSRVLLVKADITNEKDTQQVITATLKKFKKIDVLINNAGVNFDKPLEEVSNTEFSQITDTNIKGIFLMAKAVIPSMKINKQGLILNIGSKISHNTNVSPHKVLYAMTKHAVEGFSLALSKELKSHGIRVTCLMPGTANTFVSFSSKKYLHPYSLGFVISMIIKCEDIDFESIILKSKYQNI